MPLEAKWRLATILATAVNLRAVHGSECLSWDDDRLQAEARAVAADPVDLASAFGSDEAEEDLRDPEEGAETVRTVAHNVLY